MSLVEVMIVVVVLGILVAIAIPSYQSHVARSYRSEAYSELNRLANLQEQYFSDFLSYTDDMTRLGMSRDPHVSESGRYIVDTVLTSAGYRITATAAGVQVSADPDCPTLSLDRLGNKTPSECW